MEEDKDIKILQEILNRDIEDTEGTKIMKKAIQNLIARYKELEKKQNKNIQVAYGGRRYNTEGIVIDNYIPKSKVKDEISYLMQKYDLEEDYINYETVIEILQELLED